MGDNDSFNGVNLKLPSHCCDGSLFEIMEEDKSKLTFLEMNGSRIVMLYCIPVVKSLNKRYKGRMNRTLPIIDLQFP